jgi:hypothetical protein
LEDQTYLGISIGEGAATAVALRYDGGSFELLAAFAVEAAAEGPPSAALISEACSREGVQFLAAAVALESRFYMQHRVESRFTEPKQIAATVRFDTEDAISADVGDMALSFKIASKDENGSSLTVFSADRQKLFEILGQLQSAGIDPCRMEPDLHCLNRFISLVAADKAVPGTMFVFLASGSAQVIFFVEGREAVLRSAQISPEADIVEVLIRELPLTVMSAGVGGIERLVVYGMADEASLERLAEALGVEAMPLEVPPNLLARDAQGLSGAGLASACGAAMSCRQKASNEDFRRDFSPFQGGKILLRKAARTVSICLGALVFAAGLYLQMQLLQKSSYRRELHKKFRTEYSAIMGPGRKMPSRFKQAAGKLGGELRRIRDLKSGQLSATGEKSISAKLIILMKAFNGCASQTNLEIDSIAITTRSMSVSGSTSSRQNTLKFFQELKKTGLSLQQERLGSKPPRDEFQITLEAG